MVKYSESSPKASIIKSTWHLIILVQQMIKATCMNEDWFVWNSRSGKYHSPKNEQPTFSSVENPSPVQTWNVIVLESKGEYFRVVHSDCSRTLNLSGTNQIFCIVDVFSSVINLIGKRFTCSRSRKCSCSTSVKEELTLLLFIYYFGVLRLPKYK